MKESNTPTMPSEQESTALSLRNHKAYGWVFLFAAFCMLAPRLSSDFEVLRKVWQWPVLALCIYYFHRTEPDVKFRHRTWLRTYSDQMTRDHRRDMLGLGFSVLTQVWVVYGDRDLHVFGYTLPPDHLLFQAVMPLGLVGGGINLFRHSHPHTNSLVDHSLVKIQHEILGFTSLIAGFVWLGAIAVPMLAPLDVVWPILYGITAYLQITYTEVADAHHGHPAPAGADGEAAPHAH